MRGMRTGHWRVAALATVALLVVATGCSGDDGATGSGSTTTAPAPAAEPEDWPTFGHDHANTRTTAGSGLTEEDAAALEMAWSHDGAAVTSTPAVVDGVVYAGDWDGNLLAVDADTGEPVWSSPMEAGALSPSAAVTDDSVFLAGDGGVVVAADRATGERRWATDIEDTPNARIWSSPVVVDDLVIIGSASFQVFAAAAPPFRGSVVGLDAATGEERWRASVCDDPCTGVSVWSSAAVDEELGLAFIGTGQSYSVPAGPMSDSLVAIDYETGEIVWHQQYTAGDAWTLATGAGSDFDIGAAPNLFEVDGRALVGVGDKGGSYRVFDRATGEEEWVALLVAGTVLGGVEHTSAYDDGTIYVVGNTGVSATDRSIAVPTTATAFALDAASGDILWSTDLDTGGFGGVSIAGDLMLFTTHEGSLRILATDDGEELAALPIGESSASGPVVSGDTVYVGTGWDWVSTPRGSLLALRPEG